LKIEFGLYSVKRVSRMGFEDDDVWRENLLRGLKQKGLGKNFHSPKPSSQIRYGLKS
jgi:hypothetical protein